MLRGLVISLFLLGFFGCAVSAGVGVSAPVSRGTTDVTRAVILPGGTFLDESGVLIGPHGGTLTQAGNFLLETVVLRDGTVQVYAYNEEGVLIPVDQIGIGQVTLQTSRGQVTVDLQPGEKTYLVGYYDPFLYYPFYYGSIGYFQVFYPQTIFIQNRPVTVTPPAPPGGFRGGVPSTDGYPGGIPSGGVPAGRVPSGVGVPVPSTPRPVPSSPATPSIPPGGYQGGRPSTR